MYVYVYVYGLVSFPTIATEIDLWTVIQNRNHLPMTDVALVASKQSTHKNGKMHISI